MRALFYVISPYYSVQERSVAIAAVYGYNEYTIKSARNPDPLHSNSSADGSKRLTVSTTSDPLRANTS